jgi:hypothetical protein
MREVFESCVKRTLELVDGQVQALKNSGGSNPKASRLPLNPTTWWADAAQTVFVVGGFGRNQYLFSRIKDYCEAKGIQARQPGFP